jgi:cell division protein FtsB
MSAKTQKRKNKASVVKIITIVLFAGLILYCAGMLINNYADISRLNAKSDSLSEQYDQQIADNDSLKAILNSDDKDEYIEQKAREKGYVKDGEVVYYDISSSK